MSRLAKIGTVIDNRSTAARIWRRQRSRHLQPRLSREHSYRHESACASEPLKLLADFVGRGIAERIIAPVKKKFLAKSVPIVMARSCSKSRTLQGAFAPEEPSCEKVRVMRLDKGPLEFDYPPMAASLMMEYPSHVVVHYTTLRSRNKSKSFKHRPNVTIVTGFKELEAGQKYYLLPTPPTLKRLEKSSSSPYHGRVNRKSFRGGLNIGEAAPSVLQVGRGRRKKIMLSVVTQGEVDSILKSAAGGPTAELQKIEPSSKLSSWAPALGSIPESPQPRARAPLASTISTAESEILTLMRARLGREFE